MPLSQSATVRQHGILSQRMQRAIHLLQLSALDLEVAIRNAAMTNPFIEEGEEPGALETVAVDGADTGVTEAAPSADDAGLDLADGVTASESVLLDAVLTFTPDTSVADVPETFAFEKPTAAPLDATDEWSAFAGVAESRDLRDALRAQLYASRVDDRTVAAAQVVIESLDEKGYLRDPIDAAIGALPLDPPLTTLEVEAAIALVQSFEPVGVGARSLQECLLIQLPASPDDAPERTLARTILHHRMEMLARRDFQGLRKQLDCTEPELRRALAVIRRLDPDPGGRFSGKTLDYVVPDILVREVDGRFVASLNPGVRRHARLNQLYVDLFRRAGPVKSPQMREQLQEARWLVHGVEQRSETILRVAQYLTEHQHDFFAYGDSALKPMRLRDVADELGLHESTVSRATANKYMSTRSGCVEFKRFFSREIRRRQGPGSSAVSVRDRLQDLISAEDPGKPLSDVDLVRQLNAEGFDIARRTVTKYRRMLKVPPADFRRRV